MTRLVAVLIVAACATVLALVVMDVLRMLSK